DGWSFDIAPSCLEQVLALCSGDALYILTNEACYCMSDLAPDSPVFTLARHGVVSRRGAIWSEGSLFWASADGLYAATGRSLVTELSGQVRRLYTGWLQPGADTVIACQYRKLYLFSATSGSSRCLRYDFVTESWTRHNPAHTFQHGAYWRDHGSSYQQLWLLESAGNAMRWQPGAYTGDSNAAAFDAGAAIPAWSYSTGYEVTAVRERINFIFVDVSLPSGQLTVTSYKDSSSEGNRQQTYAASLEHEQAWAPDLEGYKWRMALSAPNGAQLRRLMWDKRPVDSKGG
ncbi:MAG TPA: hypothetical protein VGS41_09045, partial [Chthonomonadales bacterium]|nr:hypothetical protein [Chthonomonadales bacterium]